MPMHREGVPARARVPIARSRLAMGRDPKYAVCKLQNPRSDPVPWLH